ncbi:hypothetical protein [Zhongshania sp.]|uniref:hypothetical protein n=1 Tax=Zhongshania sp. TaxID=1971902 RepID=UPI0039E525D7
MPSYDNCTGTTLFSQAVSQCNTEMSKPSANTLIADVLGTHESNEDEEKPSWLDAEVI